MMANIATEGQFRLEGKDEYPHIPDASPNFNESVYTNAFDTASQMGGWMRVGNRVNEGYAELSVVLYLPDGRVACQFGRPAITANDKFVADGLSVEIVEPLKRLTMRYDGDLMLLDDPEVLRNPKLLGQAPRVPGKVVFETTGISPLHGGEPLSATQETMYGRDFSLAHFNQHTSVAGLIRVGDQQWDFTAARGWRDHSWGPRYWQSIYWYRLFLCSFDSNRAFMLLKITDKAGKSRRVGVLLVDGVYEDILDMDVATEWSDKQDPVKVTLGVRTANRREVITGEVLTMAPLRNRRPAGDEILVSRIAEGFTRFTWNGEVGYGMTEYIERIEDGKLVGFPL
jgi:hypothetical protein